MSKKINEEHITNFIFWWVSLLGVSIFTSYIVYIWYFFSKKHILITPVFNDLLFPVAIFFFIFLWYSLYLKYDLIIKNKKKREDILLTKKIRKKIKEEFNNDCRDNSGKNLLRWMIILLFVLIEMLLIWFYLKNDIILYSSSIVILLLVVWVLVLHLSYKESLDKIELEVKYISTVKFILGFTTSFLFLLLISFIIVIPVDTSSKIQIWNECLSSNWNSQEKSNYSLIYQEVDKVWIQKEWQKDRENVFSLLLTDECKTDLNNSKNIEKINK